MSRIEKRLQRARLRMLRNNDIPVIQERILDLLAMAKGRRLKRSQLTAKLNSNHPQWENYDTALRQLEIAGKVRCEKRIGASGRGRPGEIWFTV
jgi:hypothetical protein